MLCFDGKEELPTFAGNLRQPQRLRLPFKFLNNMKKEDLRIVYMGTPDFAVEALRCLVEGGYNVVGVITMPDKPAGRGHKLQYSPVKQYALEHNLPLLQPEKLKNEEFLDALRAWQADLQIVVAFRMLPEVVWNMPRLGTFNLPGHLQPARLPAAPVPRSCAHQLGRHQRRDGDGHHDLLPEA